LRALHPLRAHGPQRRVEGEAVEEAARRRRRVEDAYDPIGCADGDALGEGVGSDGDEGGSF
jgi:hypothetical protein